MGDLHTADLRKSVVGARIARPFFLSLQLCYTKKEKIWYDKAERAQLLYGFCAMLMIEWGAKGGKAAWPIFCLSRMTRPFDRL